MSTSNIVSVVVPCHNRQTTVARAVRSALDQGPIVGEVIVVDDASSDESVAAVEAIPDPRIRLIRLEERSGAPIARNAGLRDSSGEIVAFLDADDIWLPGLAAWHASALKAATASVCGLTAVRGDRRRRAYPRRLESDPIRSILLNRHGSFSSSCIGVTREAVEDGIQFDPDFAALQDLDFVLQAASTGTLATTRESFVVKTADSPGRIYSGRNVVLGRATFIEKWGAGLDALSGARARQLRLLLLAAANDGTEADRSAALQLLESEHRRRRSVRTAGLLVVAARRPQYLAAASRHLNRLENVTPVSAFYSLIDATNWIFGGPPKPLA